MFNDDGSPKVSKATEQLFGVLDWIEYHAGEVLLGILTFVCVLLVIITLAAANPLPTNATCRIKKVFVGFSETRQGSGIYEPRYMDLPICTTPTPTERR